MSDEIKYVDADHEDFEDAPKALRDAYKKLVAAHKETVKDLATTRETVTAKAATDVLADKGFKNPERVKRDLLADGIDPLDSSAVEGWLTANGDDYTKAAQPAAGEQEQQSAAVPQEQQLAHQQLQVTGESASNNKLAAVMAKITPEMRGEQVEALFKEYGV